MNHIIDARGLSCPQPVLLTLEAIKKAKEGELTILVDTDASKENVLRSIAAAGWNAVEVQNEDGVYRIVVNKR
jgi:TusA-related sulfurtransferase